MPRPAGLMLLSGGGGAPPFDPDSIAGLVFWIDASQEAYDDLDPADPATDWSGEGNDAFQPAGGQEPIFAEDGGAGFPAFDFPGTSEHYDVTDVAELEMDADSTVFVVVRPDDLTTDNLAPLVVKHTNASSAGSYLLGLKQTTGKPFIDRPWVEGGTEATAGLSVGTWYVVSARISSTDVDHFLNGSANGSDTLGTGTANNNPLEIGRYQDGGGTRILDGAIAEVLIYDNALSDPDVAAVHAYLLAKYGL